MTEVSREAGEIVVDASLRSLFARMRVIEGEKGAAELEVETVRDVERGLGWRLPSDVLALFAAKIRYLEEAREVSLSKIIGHTGRLRALGATGDLVGIGKESETRFVCIEKGDPSPRGSRLTVFDAETKAAARTTLLQWLEDIVEERAGAVGLAPGEPAANEDGFRPVLIRRLPAGSPGQEVIHETFGTGRVLREMGAGPNRKVQVDFPGRGLKLIQARFLRWLE